MKYKFELNGNSNYVGFKIEKFHCITTEVGSIEYGLIFDINQHYLDVFPTKLLILV